MQRDKEPQKHISPCKNSEPPDLPSLEPTPSMAAFPLIFSSSERGIKDISLVASKRVNFDALLRQFCIAPKKTIRTGTELPRTDAIAER